MAGVTRMGATKKYSENWESIFGKRRGTSSATKVSKPAVQRKQAKKKVKRARKSR